MGKCSENHEKIMGKNKSWKKHTINIGKSWGGKSWEKNQKTWENNGVTKS